VWDDFGVWDHTSLPHLPASGSWGDHTGYWHDDYMSSSTPGSQLRFTFTGTAIRIIGDWGPTLGTAHIAVDESAGQDVDLRRAVPGQQEELFAWRTAASPAPHTVTLTVTGERPVVIDEFKYLPDVERWGTTNDADLASYRQYDSSDPSVIDFHLAQIAAAKIDFLLFDVTNGGLGRDGDGNRFGNCMGGYATENHFFIDNLNTIITRLKAWNQAHAWKLKYALAVGTWWAYGNWSACPSTGLDGPQLLAAQARDVYETYVSSATYGGDAYYRHRGSPLLVVHDGGSNALENIAAVQGDPAADRFSLAPSGSDSSLPGAHGWYGWWPAAEGPVEDPEVALIEPGYNNHGPWQIPRQNGRTYQAGWRRIRGFARPPQVVVIASFNEYLEDNAVWTADTTFLDPSSIGVGDGVVVRDEQWPRPELYWDLTMATVPRLPAITDGR
jgi:hypothetical protein